MAQSPHFFLFLLFLALSFFLHFTLSSHPPRISPAPSPLASPSHASATSPSPSPANPAPGSSPSPSPAPADDSDGFNHTVGVDADVEAEDNSSGGMSAGKKAGIAFGVIVATCAVGLAGMAYKKRRNNLQRSHYGYVARRELL